MNLNEIEELVKIVRDARVSELTVSVGDSTVKLRKPLTQAPPVPKPKPKAKTEAPKPEAKPAAVEPEPADVYITAPMVGIFHSIDSVGAIESPVKAGQVMGVIESMKLMNDVISDHDGVLAEVLIEDDMPVEFGQRLFRIRNGW